MQRGEAIQVHGLKEVLRDLGKMDPTLRRKLAAELRKLVRGAAQVAKEKAAAQGFTPPGRSGRGTGALIRDIKYRSFVSREGYVGLIRETATRSGTFRYPAVFEYGHSHWGHRPFLEPTRQAVQPFVYEELTRVLNEQVDAFNRPSLNVR
jgi:hypothetical protein